MDVRGVLQRGAVAGEVGGAGGAGVEPVALAPGEEVGQVAKVGPAGVGGEAGQPGGGEPVYAVALGRVGWRQPGEGVDGVLDAGEFAVGSH